MTMRAGSPSGTRRIAHIAETASAAELPPDPFAIVIEARNTSPFLSFLELISQSETLPNDFTRAIRILRREFLKQCGLGADIPLDQVLQNFIQIKLDTDTRPEQETQTWLSMKKKKPSALAVPMNLGSAVRRLSAMLRPGEDEVIPIRRALLLTYEDEQQEGEPQAQDAEPTHTKTRSGVRRSFWDRFFCYRSLSRTDFQDLASAPEMSTGVVPGRPSNNRAASDVSSPPSRSGIVQEAGSPQLRLDEKAKKLRG
jgi:hypothetical protein